MKKGDIISLVLGLISVLLSFIGYYFYVRSEIYKRTEEAINNAEATGEVGREKLKSATEQLYLTVPSFLRSFIGRDAIEVIVQSAFDKIEEYAKKQIKKAI